MSHTINVVYPLNNGKHMRSTFGRHLFKSRCPRCDRKSFDVSNLARNLALYYLECESANCVNSDSDIERFEFLPSHI